MKFQIKCMYQVTANNYTTHHESNDIVSAMSAIQAITEFLDGLGNAMGATSITNISIDARLTE